jgi:hypothetical protein
MLKRLTEFYLGTKYAHQVQNAKPIELQSFKPPYFVKLPPDNNLVNIFSLEYDDHLRSFVEYSLEPLIVFNSEDENKLLEYEKVISVLGLTHGTTYQFIDSFISDPSFYCKKFLAWYMFSTCDIEKFIEQVDRDQLFAYLDDEMPVIPVKFESISNEHDVWLYKRYVRKTPDPFEWNVSYLTCLEWLNIFKEMFPGYTLMYDPAKIKKSFFALLRDKMLLDTKCSVELYATMDSYVSSFTTLVKEQKTYRAMLYLHNIPEDAQDIDLFNGMIDSGESIIVIWYCMYYMYYEQDNFTAAERLTLKPVRPFVSLNLGPATLECQDPSHCTFERIISRIVTSVLPKLDRNQKLEFMKRFIEAYLRGT